MSALLANPKAKILLVASVPSTLWAFFRGMPKAAAARGIELAVASSPGPELGFFEEQYGIKAHAVVLPRAISPLRDLTSVVRLARILRRHRFDVVHAMTAKAGLVAMTAAAAARTPHRVYSILGLAAERATGLTRRLLLNAERTTARLAHVVLACSPSLRDQVERLGVCSGPKLSVLADGSSCGIDTERFARTQQAIEGGRAKRRALGIPDDALVLGYVGRLVLDKGIHTLVDCFLKLADGRENLYLLLVGDYEPHRGRVSSQTVERIRTHPRIKHLPFDWDPVPCYAAMDVLMLATYREGFPRAPLEAGCMGVPTVATRATGCVDAIVDAETGYLCDIEDVADLSASAGRLLDDPALRARMGEAAKRRVGRLFTEDRLLDEYFKLYDSLLARPPGRDG